MEITREYINLGIDLKNYICNYKPGNWVAPISNFAHIPWIMPFEARILMKAHRDNSLDKTLEDLGKDFEPWYVKEAIKDYFVKEKFSEIKQIALEEEE